MLPKSTLGQRRNRLPCDRGLRRERLADGLLVSSPPSVMCIAKPRPLDVRSLSGHQFVGHLGADPEVQRTQDGRSIANLRLAASELARQEFGRGHENTE